MQPIAQRRRLRPTRALRVALVVAAALALAAACSFHVDDYAVAPPDPCAGGCVSCGAVANEQARAGCLCADHDAGGCPTPSSQALFVALAACAAQSCPVECAALGDAGAHPTGSPLTCTACAEGQCKAAMTACLADTTDCPR